MVGAPRLPTLPLNILSPDHRAGKRMRTRVAGGGEVAMVDALRLPTLPLNILSPDHRAGKRSAPAWSVARWSRWWVRYAYPPYLSIPWPLTVGRVSGAHPRGR